MIEVVETAIFARWLAGLRDREARGRIVARTRRRDIACAIELARSL